MMNAASKNAESSNQEPSSTEPNPTCPSPVDDISEKLSDMNFVDEETDCHGNIPSKSTETNPPDSQYSECCTDNIGWRDEGPDERTSEQEIKEANGIQNEDVGNPRRDVASFAGDLKELSEEAATAMASGIEKDLCREVDGEQVPLFFLMDCEASSGVPYRDDIVEIALKCWPYRDNVEDSLFYSLIHTSKYLCKFAMCHGFSKKLLKNQPSFKEVMNKLFDWLKKTTTNASQYLHLHLFPVLLCHGGEAFDYPLLFSQLERTGMSFQRLEELNLHFADTYTHLKMYQTAKHPLLVGCRMLGIDNLLEQWFGPQHDKVFHRAQNDVDSMLRVFSQTPLYGFLQDIPIYSTAEWIDYYEEKKYDSKIKRELADNIPTSISGIQRKFIIKQLVRNGLDLDSLRALYMECAEPHHFRQELVDLGIKGTNASKLMVHFFSNRLTQAGTKKYVVKIKENMQPMQWTHLTNARGRKFSQHVANVLPPIFPSGGSGFNFDDATGPSMAEQLKDIMESFAKFQLQFSSAGTSCGDHKSWIMPPEFWNNINKAERIYTVDEDKDLPVWEEMEQDWQSEVHDVKRAPLLPTPRGLPVSFNYRGCSSDNDEVRQRPLIPWDEIQQETMKAKQEKQKQLRNVVGKGRQENNEFWQKNYRRGRRTRWKHQPQRQQYAPGDTLHVRREHSFRQASCGHTSQASDRHISQASNGNTTQASDGHTVQSNDGDTAQPNTSRNRNNYWPRNGMIWNKLSHDCQPNKRNENSRTNQKEQGAKRKTYFKQGQKQANDGHTAQANTSRNGMRQNKLSHDCQPNNRNENSRTNQNEEQGAKRKTYFMCQKQKQGEKKNKKDEEFSYKHRVDGYSEKDHDFEKRNTISKSSNYRETQPK